MALLKVLPGMERQAVAAVQVKLVRPHCLTATEAMAEMVWYGPLALELTTVAVVVAVLLWAVPQVLVVLAVVGQVTQKAVDLQLVRQGQQTQVAVGVEQGAAVVLQMERRAVRAW